MRVLLIVCCAVLALLAVWYSAWYWEQASTREERALASAYSEILFKPGTAEGWADLSGMSGADAADKYLQIGLYIDPQNIRANSSLALLRWHQNKLDEAEKLYKRTLSLSERAPGPHSIELVKTLDELALFYEAHGRHAEAELNYNRALHELEKALGCGDRYTAAFLCHVGDFYLYRGNPAKAEPLYRRCLSIQLATAETESKIGPFADTWQPSNVTAAFPFNVEHPSKKYAQLLRQTGRAAAAARFDSLVHEVSQYHDSVSHPATREMKKPFLRGITRALSAVPPLKDSKTLIAAHSCNGEVHRESDNRWWNVQQSPF